MSTPIQRTRDTYQWRYQQHIRDGGLRSIEQIRAEALKDGIDHCPYCEREVSRDPHMWTAHMQSYHAEEWDGELPARCVEAARAVEDSISPDNLLPDAEAAELSQHEAVIERGLKTFYEVGAALTAIREKRLYRATHNSFEDYCQERWQLTQRRAYQMMDAVLVVNNVYPGTHYESIALPEYEKHVRPLVALSPEEQQMAWAVVQQTAPGGKVTASHVKSVVTVLKEVVQTGAIDPGTGESIPLVAEALKSAVTEEMYERMKRQESYIVQAQAQKVRQAAAKQARIEAAHLPDAKYRVIYADPPWSYGNTMPAYFTEQAQHYRLMTLEEICALPIREMTQEDAVLFLWVTAPILMDALQVIGAWGFRYKTNIVWDKVKHNLGHYISVRHEHLLLCTRGSCLPDVNKLYDSVQVVERSDHHSEKPEAFRALIDTLYPNGRRLELFARVRVDGWDAYGNEIEGDDSCRQEQTG